MVNMNVIGNKFDITMFEWCEVLVKAENKLAESIKCNEMFGGNEEWIAEDTEKLNKAKQDIDSVKQKFKSMNIQVDYQRLYDLAKNESHHI